MSIDFSSVLPPLTDEQYETLKASIAANGVVDPVLIWEETGEAFDGFHRLRCCEELEITDYPRKVMSFADADAVEDFIHAKHFGRRHLTREQQEWARERRKERAVALRVAGLTVRRIAAKLGCAPSTVHAALAGDISLFATEQTNNRDEEIRTRFAAGESQSELAQAFLISQGRISQIVKTPPADMDVDLGEYAWSAMTCPDCGETHRHWESDSRMGVRVCGKCLSVFYTDDERVEHGEPDGDDDDPETMTLEEFMAVTPAAFPAPLPPPALTVGDLPGPIFPTMPEELRLRHQLMGIAIRWRHYDAALVVSGWERDTLEHGAMNAVVLREFAEWVVGVADALDARATGPRLRRVGG